MTAAVKPQGCTNLKVRQLSRALGRHYDARFADTGLSTTQYALLSQVVVNGPLRPSQLAQQLKLDNSTLTRTLQPLIAAGYVELNPGEDARSRSVEATRAGRIKRSEAQRVWKQAQLALNKQLGEARVARLHSLLEECMALLEEA